MATKRHRLRTLASSSSDWRRSRSEMTVIPVDCLSQHLKKVKMLASHNFRRPPPPPPLTTARHRQSKINFTEEGRNNVGVQNEGTAGGGCGSM